MFQASDITDGYARVLPLWGSVFVGLVCGSLGKTQLIMISIVGLGVIVLFAMTRLRDHDGLASLIMMHSFHLGVGLLIGAESRPIERNFNLAPYAGVRAVIDRVVKDGHLTHIKAIGEGKSVIWVTTKQKQPFKEGDDVWLSGPFSERRAPINFANDVDKVTWTSNSPLFKHSETEPASISTRIRLYIVNTLQELEPPTARQILTALTLGRKEGMSPRIMSTVSAVGGNHLLAVSGLHIVGFAGFVYFCLVRILIRFRHADPQTISLALSLLVALFLLDICKYSIGGIRAICMFGVFCVGKWCGRPSSVLESLFFSASVIQIFDPLSWKNIGFILSFAAVFGIVTRSKGSTALTSLWSASFWSTVATAPFCTYFFGEFSLYGPFTNLVLIPFVTLVVMPLSWLGLSLSPISIEPLNWAAQSALFLVALMESMTSYGSKTWQLGYEATLCVGLFCLGVWLWRASRITSILILLMGWMCTGPTLPTVNFLAVGQGDATLVSDGGANALIDVGPKTNSATVIRTLKRLGVRKIDVVVITHLHGDHYGALNRLAEYYPIGEVIWNGRRLPTQELRRLRQSMIQAGTEWKQASAESLMIGGIELVILPPVPIDTTSENDASVAVMAKHQDISILITGDREYLGEKQLLRQNLGAFAVLRGGHHGSKTSSNDFFLDATLPKHLVLSMGDNNRFGFPHDAVIKRAEHRSIRVWRTDRDGRVTVKFNGAPSIGAVRQPDHVLELTSQ